MKTFDIFAFRKLKTAKYMIRYVENHTLPEAVNIKNKNYEYNEYESEDEYEYEYNPKFFKFQTWQAIAYSWNMNEEFVLRFARELSKYVDTLRKNKHIQLKDETYVALKLMK